jgi:SPX domain protein involved in polyphosphate accumulation
MKDPFRYELKFVLNDRQLIQARSWIAAETTASSRYRARIVNSLYYDTADLCALKDNLYGIADRVKHRLRWYTNLRSPDANGACFEVKRRLGRLNKKNRLELADLADSIKNGSNLQIRELLIQHVNGSAGFEKIGMYYPTLQVEYSRDYFEDMNGLRLTLDQGIRFYLTPLSEKLFFGQGARYPWSVMEMKFPQHLKNNVSKRLRGLRITPKRHSKYAAGLAAFGQARYF